MSYGAQTGVIAIGPQVSKGVLPGSPTWYQFRATDIDFDQISPGGVLPPEIAGILTPTGAYKAGIFAAGGFSLIPRLEDQLGWLLYAAMGDVASGSIAAGVYEHKFLYPTDQTVLPWVSVRRQTPGSTSLDLNVQDCKVARMRLTVPQAGPVAMRLDMVGRQPTLPSGSSWSYETMDDSDSFPIANATGYFKLPDFSGTALPVTGMIFEWANLMTTPQEEMVVGSNYPDDFGIRARAMTARFVYRWTDPDLYRTIMTGYASGSATWTPQVFTTDLEAVISTPGNWVPTGTPTDPLTLKILAEKVEFMPNGPIRLMGNQTIAVEYVGTVLDPASGDYCSITLKNAVTDYTWPTS